MLARTAYWISQTRLVYLLVKANESLIDMPGLKYEMLAFGYNDN